MRKEFLTEDELLSQLRLQGVLKIADIKLACLEANGEISVVKKDDQANSTSNKRKKLF